MDERDQTVCGREQMCLSLAHVKHRLKICPFCLDTWESGWYFLLPN